MAAIILGERRLLARPAEVAPARRWLGALLTAGHAAVADDVVLMACEAITNAIRHSDSSRPDEHGEPGTVTVLVWDVAGAVRVEVIDAGSPHRTPTVTDDGLDGLGGRGLHIIELLSRGRWGTRAHEGGRTVWFETCL